MGSIHTRLPATNRMAQRHVAKQAGPRPRAGCAQWVPESPPHFRFWSSVPSPHFRTRSRQNRSRYRSKSCLWIVFVATLEKFTFKSEEIESDFPPKIMLRTSVVLAVVAGAAAFAPGAVPGLQLRTSAPAVCRAGAYCPTSPSQQIRSWVAVCIGGSEGGCSGGRSGARKQAGWWRSAGVPVAVVAWEGWSCGPEGVCSRRGWNTGTAFRAAVLNGPKARAWKRERETDLLRPRPRREAETRFRSSRVGCILSGEGSRCTRVSDRVGCIPDWDHRTDQVGFVQA